MNFKGIEIKAETTLMCAATFCPLFASEGSPWTGQKNTPCSGDACGWHSQGRCDGADSAGFQVAEAIERGAPPLQLAVAVFGAKPPSYFDRGEKSFDCPHASTCKWQDTVGPDRLCPPRFALAHGVDPRTCAY